MNCGELPGEPGDVLVDRNPRHDGKEQLGRFASGTGRGGSRHGRPGLLGYDKVVREWIGADKLGLFIQMGVVADPWPK